MNRHVELIPAKLGRILIPILVFITIVIVCIIVWWLNSSKKVVSRIPDKPSLSIMYFKNNTGIESLDHWRKELAKLLIVNLSQSNCMRVLNVEKNFDILEELNLAENKSYSLGDFKEVAARGEVEHILWGNFAMRGDTFRIYFILQNVNTGDVICSEILRGKGEEGLLSMVNEITQIINAKLRC